MRNSMKVAATATVILVASLLTASPAAAQQQEPPGGWLGLAYRNAMNVPTAIAANHDSFRCENDITAGRFPSGCLDYHRRIFSGQIPRLLWDAREYEYWTRGYGVGYYGNFGNYGSGYLGWGSGGYFWQGNDTGTKVMLGTLIGVGVANLIQSHRRGNDQKRRDNEVVEATKANTEALERVAALEKELLELKERQSGESTAPAPDAQPASPPASTPVAPAAPAGTGTVLNGTGCDVVLLDRTGKRLFVPKGTEAALALEGIQSSIVNGACDWDLSITYNEARTHAVLTCSPPVKEGGN